GPRQLTARGDIRGLDIPGLDADRRLIRFDTGGAERRSAERRPVERRPAERRPVERRRADASRGTPGLVAADRPGQRAASAAWGPAARPRRRAAVGAARRAAARSRRGTTLTAPGTAAFGTQDAMIRPWAGRVVIDGKQFAIDGRRFPFRGVTYGTFRQ